MHLLDAHENRGELGGKSCGEVVRPDVLIVFYEYLSSYILVRSFLK